MNKQGYLSSMRALDRLFLDAKIKQAEYEKRRKALVKQYLLGKFGKGKTKGEKGKSKKKSNPCRIHCGKCGRISPKGYNFNERMTWLRSHRKKKHS